MPSGIPFGLLADKYGNRKIFLASALAVWSASIVWTGFSQTYTEVLFARFLLGLAESACTPFAASLITDYFPKETRATALGIYNWGIYTGFSLAVGAANAMTDTAGWRTVWYACLSLSLSFFFVIVSIQLRFCEIHFFFFLFAFTKRIQSVCRNKKIKYRYTFGFAGLVWVFFVLSIKEKQRPRNERLINPQSFVRILFAVLVFVFFFIFGCNFQS